MVRHTSRRSFLSKVAGSAALLPAAVATLGRVSPLAAAAPGDGEDYWTMVRRQFAFRESKVPMNAANLCPSPRIVAERVTQLTENIDVDCSFQSREKFTSSLEASRL